MFLPQSPLGMETKMALYSLMRLPLTANRPAHHFNIHIFHEQFDTLIFFSLLPSLSFPFSVTVDSRLSWMLNIIEEITQPIHT